MRLLPAGLAALSFLITATSFADTTYDYQSGNYSLAYGPYTTSQSTSGSFSFAGTLAPGLTGASLVPLSNFSFNDGVESFTLPSSTVDYFAPYTDSSGDLTSFFLELVTSLPGSTPTNLYTNDLIISYGPAFTGTVQTIAFEDRANQSTALAETLSNGTLTPTSVSTTPEPSSLALLATGALGIAGVLRKRMS